MFGGLFPFLWSLVLLGSGLRFVAIGALIRLAIHVEENTRVSAQCLEKLASRIEPIEQRVGATFRS
ncbi:MAG: hypothetical protein U0790_15950 [Isosphaeraceae bacterium]